MRISPGTDNFTIAAYGNSAPYKPYFSKWPDPTGARLSFNSNIAVYPAPWDVDKDIPYAFFYGDYYKALTKNAYYNRNDYWWCRGYWRKKLGTCDIEPGKQYIMDLEYIW